MMLLNLFSSIKALMFLQHSCSNVKTHLCQVFKILGQCKSLGSPIANPIKLFFIEKILCELFKCLLWLWQ